MPFYSYINRATFQELFKLPEEVGESGALSVVETFPQDIVFWSDDDLEKQEVWLSFEQISYYEGSFVIGVSSNERLAMEVCQSREDNWGDKAVQPLPWGEDHPHGAEGYLRRYSVAKHIVDEGVE